MGGYYIPSSFSANYVSNKKNEDGTYQYDSAVNKAGIDAQRNMQQLNKQYNVTINNAYAQNLLANRGLQASALGQGFKDAYAQNLQANLANQMNEFNLSVQDTKQQIFQSLAQDLTQIGQAQQQEVGNMRRMAQSLEQYHGYLKTLRSESGTLYAEDQKFDLDGEFEQNYQHLFGANKGTVAGYRDENASPGLSLEDWLRQTSGTSEADTAWLDWVYGTGYNQYKDFIKNGILDSNSVFKAYRQEIANSANNQPPTLASTKRPKPTYKSKVPLSLGSK